MLCQNVIVAKIEGEGVPPVFRDEVLLWGGIDGQLSLGYGVEGSVIDAAVDGGAPADWQKEEKKERKDIKAHGDT